MFPVTTDASKKNTKKTGLIKGSPNGRDSKYFMTLLKKKNL